MCLDNILTQKIWSVDYFAAFKKSLEELSFGGNNSIVSEVVDQNRDLVSVMQAKLTTKSVYMLTYISILLFICGVEADQKSPTIYMFVVLQAFAVSNSKSLMKNIYHGVKPEFLQEYLNEFCYKFNRRYFGDKLFDRLMVASITYTSDFEHRIYNRNPSDNCG